MDINKITHEIIAYEKCLVYELAERGLFVESQIVLPLSYKNIMIDAGYRLDIRVERRVIVEVKAVDEVHPVHKAQLLCYMRLSPCKVGLILNFNELRPVDGITRMILD